MEYIFNENGICMNPDIEKVIESDDCCCELRLACDCIGRWYYGISVSYKGAGFSSGVSNRLGSYVDRNSARSFGLGEIRRYLSRFGADRYARILDSRLQLELFNQ